ncbi:MAG: GNAT family N-acetyltransferase [Hyphomicrobiaceae bacterium]
MIVRDWQEADLATLHAINEASVPGVGPLTYQALDHLVRHQSAAVLVADVDGAPAGFVLCMLEGLDYASLNYKWVSQRYDRFAYIDRVAVAENRRGQRIGEALYAAAVDRFSGRRDVLLAEVNLAPPNPGSLRFHKRNGFEERGERWEIEGEKGVVYLERKLG